MQQKARKKIFKKGKKMVNRKQNKTVQVQIRQYLKQVQIHPKTNGFLKVQLFAIYELYLKQNYIKRYIKKIPT